ncbi:hypothetical protein V6Z11_D06G043700 [Gossypium hirsutum]
MQTEIIAGSQFFRNQLFLKIYERSRMRALVNTWSSIHFLQLNSKVILFLFCMLSLTIGRSLNVGEEKLLLCCSLELFPWFLLQKERFTSSNNWVLNILAREPLSPPPKNFQWIHQGVALCFVWAMASVFWAG